MQEMAFEQLRDPIRRRWWLLIRALESLPLDAALALANRAEAFVLNGADGRHAQTDVLAVPERLNSAQTPASSTAAVPAREAEEEAASAARRKVMEEASPAVCAPNAEATPKAAIMARFADGASNATVAAEFGLTQRQVQGFRMQLARGKSNGSGAATGAPTISPNLPASAEAVIRYLRQQGDVVVTADNGRFLLNGRFTLAFAELVQRANRMLARNGKDLFTPALFSTAAVLSQLQSL